MPSPTSNSQHPASRADVLLQLNRQLESAERLTAEMRQGLRDADADAIDAAAARLRTLALECKLLHEEYRRFPVEPMEADGPGFAEARALFERTATRLARNAAVSGGLLARLVELSRQLIESLGPAGGDTYMPSGRTRENPVGGVGLRELA